MIRDRYDYVKKVNRHVDRLEEFNETNEYYSIGWKFNLYEFLLERYKKMSVFALGQMIGEELTGCNIKELEDVIDFIAYEKTKDVDKIYKVQLIGAYDNNHKELNIFANRQVPVDTHIMVTFKDDDIDDEMLNMLPIAFNRYS